MKSITLFALVLILPLIQGSSLRDKLSRRRHFVFDNAKSVGRLKSCVGRLEVISFSGAKVMEFYAHGFKKRNIRVKRRGYWNQEFLAKSYGNCCWSLYPRYSKNFLKSKFINCLIWIFISEGIKAEKESNWSILQLQSSTLLPNLTKPPMLVEIEKY